jgi:hypothetical protein
MNLQNQISRDPKETQASARSEKDKEKEEKEKKGEGILSESTETPESHMKIW